MAVQCSRTGPEPSAIVLPDESRVQSPDAKEAVGDKKSASSFAERVWPVQTCGLVLRQRVGRTHHDAPCFAVMSSATHILCGFEHEKHDRSKALRHLYMEEQAMWRQNALSLV